MEDNRLNTIDRRTKEYKDAVELINTAQYISLEEVEEVEELNKSSISKTEYDKIMNFKGLLPHQEKGWIVALYKRELGIAYNEKNLTGLQVYQMIDNLTKKYRKDNDYN